MRKANIGPYSIVPEWLIDSARAEPLRLFCLLARYANEGDGKAWPSQKTLAQRLGCTERAVRKWMAELIELGAVQVVGRTTPNGDPDTNLYILDFTDPELRAQGSAPPEHLFRKGYGTSVQEGYGTHVPEGYGTHVPTKENHLNENHLNEREQTRAHAREAPPPRHEKTASPSDFGTVPKPESFQNRNCSNGSHPPPAKRLSGDSESAAGESGYFERTLQAFRAAYPVPAGGMPSERTLRMAWHDVRLRGEDLAAIVEGAKRYAAFCASEPDRPVQDPRNWLRGREWERDWTPAEDAEDVEFQRLMAEKRAARTPEQQAIYLAKLEEDRRLLEREGHAR